MNEYHDGRRELQDRFDTRRLADRLAEGASETFSDTHAAFVEARDMFFIASTGKQGFPDCSYKGGDPGFVRVVDESTIAFPVFDCRRPPESAHWRPSASAHRRPFEH